MTKRTLDLFVALLGIILLSPLLFLIGLAVLKYLGWPVLFRQNRPGYHGKIFSFYKYRTMTNEKDSYGRLLEDKNRMTALGGFLRATSLDELPSLFNVLKGDMSLVGPRPLLVEYLELYSAEQMRRHDVKPGITGWAQINGRNAISWEEKFKLDVWYVENQSLWLDIKILFLTSVKVFAREGINSETSVTMEQFRGSL
jgi:lipopolysaccharide/colanic/teichoic acid biosynthesis glycosyltransferase